MAGVDTDVGAGADIGLSDRDERWQDATYGVRVAFRGEGSETSVLVFSGSDPEPVLRLDRSGATPSALRDPPRRTLLGATHERSASATVLRAEAAYVPDRSVNLRPDDPGDGFELGTRMCPLVGTGVDWNAPANLFVDAQLAADLSGGDDRRRFLPARQTVGTLRVSRGFANERLQVRGEWIGSPEEGDGATRPRLDWQRSDNVFFRVGADVFYGDGAFGQFDDADRVWAKVKVSRSGPIATSTR